MEVKKKNCEDSSSLSEAVFFLTPVSRTDRLTGCAFLCQSVLLLTLLRQNFFFVAIEISVARHYPPHFWYTDRACNVLFRGVLNFEAPDGT